MMAQIPNTQDSVQTERRILRLLCQVPAARVELGNALRPYRWRDLVHQIVYQIISGAPQLPPEQIHQMLPTRLTNAGFPDFPCDELFLPADCSIREAELFLRQLQSPATS